MADILHADFKTKTRQYTRRPMLEQMAHEIISQVTEPATLDYTQLCDQIDAHNERIAERASETLYESSLGFIAPDTDPA